MITGSLKNRRTVILLAEDDPADQEITRRAMKEAQIENALYVVENGEEAMDFLNRRGEYENPSKSPRPDLILLDINMPRMDGKQVLAEIRKTPGINTLPVVMLTTSRHEKDILETYELGVNAYVTKPEDLENFVKMVHTLKMFWLDIAVLPG